MKNIPTINKYIDPMVDFGFKKIFKESGKKQLIIRPLNAIFGLDIEDIEIKDSEQLGLTEQERRATYDMHCTTRDGSKFIIEVQLADQPFFMERAIFYSSLTIAKDAERGKWNYSINPIFFLGLLNFDIRHLEPEKADPQQFIHKFLLREEQTTELMSDRLRFAFLEIQRFDKEKEECITFEDRFLYIMKNLPTFAEKPDLWEDPYFNEMIEEAEYASMTMEQRYQYALAMKQKWDYQNQLEFAEQKGKSEGLAEGRSKGLAEGHSEGLAEGREAERIETARRMLAMNLAEETILAVTGLSVEQLRSL